MSPLRIQCATRSRVFAISTAVICSKSYGHFIVSPSLGLPARCSPHTQGLRRALGTGAGLGFVETVNLLTGLTALTALTDMKSVRHATIVYADMAGDGGRVAVLLAEVYRARLPLVCDYLLHRLALPGPPGPVALFNCRDYTTPYL